MRNKLIDNISFLILIAFGVIISGCKSSNDADVIAVGEEIDKFLHVSSPAWEDQILYFIVTDRFMDGDTSNNDQGEGEYRPGDERFWNGGDLQGITQKIDYIKKLGPTGIWITPPVANQWRNPQHTGTGNHGYWASSFIEVDKHYGTLEDYKQLSASLHKNGMYLVQDVVCNHLGDFHTYAGPYNPDDITENFKVHNVPQPTQYPFNHNNALDSGDREMAIYHFAPTFHDHSDTIKKRLYQFADLDDLNTANPVVRDVLRSSYNFWISEVGVDGFRFDTPHMVEHEFWHDFIHSNDSENPGVERFARSLGKQKFLTFGETVTQTLQYDHGGTYEAAKYLGTRKRPEMVSVLNFPLVNSINRVFKEKKPTDLLTFRLEGLERIFEHPEWLLNFIDNHDGARFLSQADHTAFRQALLFIMTIPGIPVIYYGTEQEFLGTRRAMFKGGVGSPDQDHFNTDPASFKFVQDLISLRKQFDVFRRGTLKVLRDASGGPGIFAYKLTDQDAVALVLFNTSNSPKLADNIHTELEPGTILKTRFSLSASEKKYPVNKEGVINLIVPAGTGMILLPDGKEGTSLSLSENISIHPLEDSIIKSELITITGEAKNVDEVLVIMDGNYERAITPEMDKDGVWSADLSLDHLLNGAHSISAISKREDDPEFITSNTLEFELSRPAILYAEYLDASGDDWGPEGKYRYPTNPSYTKQMDLREVKVYGSGTNLKIDITMSEITGIWLPPNGFDHVLINIYIDLPGREGTKVLPLQNAFMPGGARWDYRIAAAGFSNSIFSSEGASEDNPGTSTGPTAFISVNEFSKTISLEISSEALDFPEELKGTKLYINTWEGGPSSLRELKPDPEPWAFSRGDESDPKIMDETELIILN
jgi:glycosidase